MPTDPVATEPANTEPTTAEPATAEPSTPRRARDRLSGRATQVAPLLLGASIEATSAQGTVRVRLTEVEAYEGADDAASHAFRGPTPRNQVMFGPAGFLYVYFVYGMHWCANIVCGPPGLATAVLLRAGEVTTGIGLAASRRPAAHDASQLASGPARLASCLALTGADYGTDLLARGSRVRLQLPRRPMGADLIEIGPRVGVGAPLGVDDERARRAVDDPLRFWLRDEPSVSAYRRRVDRTRQTGPL